MASKYDDLIQSERQVIIIYEGLGSYIGNPQDKKFHPKGRLGALLVAYKNGKEVYRTVNCSTLPDSLDASYAKKYNGGSPIPTVYEGKFKLYTKMHLGKYEAYELGKGNEFIDVIRGNEPSGSNGINLHQRSNENDYSSFANSTGCITVLKGNMETLLDKMGVKSFNGEFGGILLVDRSNISNSLATLYKEYYGKMFSHFSSIDIGITKVEIELKKQREIKELKAKFQRRKINETEEWKNQKLKSGFFSPFNSFFDLMNRLR